MPWLQSVIFDNFLYSLENHNWLTVVYFALSTTVMHWLLQSASAAETRDLIDCCGNASKCRYDVVIMRLAVVACNVLKLEATKKAWTRFQPQQCGQLINISSSSATIKNGRLMYYTTGTKLCAAFIDFSAQNLNIFAVRAKFFRKRASRYLETEMA